MLLLSRRQHHCLTLNTTNTGQIQVPEIQTQTAEMPEIVVLTDIL